MSANGTTGQGWRSAGWRRGQLVVGLLWCCGAVVSAQAGDIYKSVDANGRVIYSDHPDPAAASTVIPIDSPSTLPGELHFCWTNCFTLVLDNGAYRRVDGTAETWSIQTFSSSALVLHRHDAPADWNGYSKDVVYAGRVTNGRLVGATVNGRPVADIDAAWGPALYSVPGNNAERDARTDAAPASALTSAEQPPAVIIEDQPPLPADGYLWTPGYWSWRAPGYVWIAGSWQRPPRVGYLWTPGFWLLAGTLWAFHPGHWGSSVGSYGGQNYGNGYSGHGYAGGHWVGASFAYNTALNHLPASLAISTYSQPVPGQTSRVPGTDPVRSTAAANLHGGSATPAPHPVASPSAAPMARSTPPPAPHPTGSRTASSNAPSSPARTSRSPPAGNAGARP